MTKVLYTAEAQVSGGRLEGHGRTTDGALDVELRPPNPDGSDPGGTNPEQLFAVGYAACFENAVRTIARRRKVEVGETRVDTRVMLVPGEERSFKLAVELDLTLPDLGDAGEAAELVAAAHKVCPCSNATRGNIEVKLTANGEPVG